MPGLPPFNAIRPQSAGRAPGVVVSPSAAKVIAAGAVPGTGVAVAVPGRVGASPPPITVSAMAFKKQLSKR